MTATLRSLGFAVPRAWDQEGLAAGVADAWGLAGGARDRWMRIARGTSIRRRHAIAELGETMTMSTAERMRAYERHAPSLAASAAGDALARAGLVGGDVTDCVVVSCTGFAAPGVGARMSPTLGLTDGVRHTQIGFMGCFGAILGLRAARGIVAADPAAVVLVVCVELCSLHMRSERGADGMIAAALFADGAAAAIVDGRGGDGGLGSLGMGKSLLVPGTADAMTWTVKDDGFAMTLAKEVPVRLESEIGPFFRTWSAVPPVAAPIVHPGGPAIIDAVERGLGAAAREDATKAALAASRTVLADHGNMSSGSVLFVLEEFLRRGGRAPLQLVAFGPGLTIDAIELS